MRTRLATSVSTGILFLAAVGLEHASAANVETIRPTSVTKHALTFDVDNVEPTEVTGAEAHLWGRRYLIHRLLARRYENRPVARQLAKERIQDRLNHRLHTGRVTRAAETGELLRLSKPRYATGGSLKVRKGGRQGNSALDTMITSGPSGTISSSSVSFAFSSSLPDTSFECSVDGGAWAQCSSPKTYGALEDGSHVFAVRAKDAAGNPDTSPASRSFTVSTSTSLPFSVDNWPALEWNVFGERSPWNTKIDHATAPVDPNSATMIKSLVADGPPSAPGMNSIRNWGTPIYFGRSSDPLFRLGFTDSYDYVREINGLSIHVPGGARPSAGADGVMWVVDQTDGFAYMLQQATIDEATHTITARRGYRLSADGLGFRYPSVPPTGVQPIRPEELAAGYVNHAMSMGAECLSGHPVAPFDESRTLGKTCSGDTDASSTRLSMGNVVFLDMSDQQIDALSVPTWQKAILKGLADYGAVVGLNGGNAWALKFENPIDRTSLGQADPYGAAGLPSTLDFSHALDSVGGWGSHLKVLAPFGRPCSGVCS